MKTIYAPAPTTTMAIGNEANRPAVNVLQEMGHLLKEQKLAEGDHLADAHNSFWKAMRSVIAATMPLMDRHTALRLKYVGSVIAPIVVQANKTPGRAPQALQAMREEAEGGHVQYETTDSDSD